MKALRQMLDAFDKLLGLPATDWDEVEREVTLEVLSQEKDYEERNS